MSTARHDDHLFPQIFMDCREHTKRKKMCGTVHYYMSVSGVAQKITKYTLQYVSKIKVYKPKYTNIVQ